MTTMKLIDKSALVAEIERLKSADLSHLNGEQTNIYLNTLVLVGAAVCNLEVKEVDLKTSIDDYINSHFTERCDGGMISDWYKVLGGVHYKDLMELAKHFFELGMKMAQKGEEV